MAIVSERAPSRVSTFEQFALSSLWFGFFAQWIPLIQIVVPLQVAAIAGSRFAEGYVGTVIAAGAWVALFVAPVAGALSDRARGRYGRRRPFLIVGVLASCASLLLLALPIARTSLWIYGLVFLNLQFWGNWWSGPFAGLVPDVVPPAQRASASAWINTMGVLGTLGGMALATIAVAHARLDLFLIAIAVLLAGGLVLTLACVREPAAEGARVPFEIGAFVRSFYLPPNEHPRFYWVLATRFLANMGVWSVGSFFIFYLERVVRLQNARTVGPALIGAAALIALPAGIVAARATSRYGFVAVVRAGAWIMALAAAAFVAISARPNAGLAIAIIALYGIGYGAFQAVDWALALDVLPATDESGKDMGVWHVALVLPQIVAPVSVGWLIVWLRAVSDSFAYTVAFGIAAVWFVGAAALVGRARARV